MSSRELQEALRPLPGDALVPVAWVRERLGQPEDELTGDLTVPEVAETLGRSEQRVCDYLREGRLEGYKFGAQWRVTRSALQTFLDRLREGEGNGEDPAGDHRSGKLGDWREQRSGS